MSRIQHPSSALISVFIKRLERRYGRPEWQQRLSPLEELVFTILSQNTTDANAARSLAALKQKYPEWRQVAGGPPGSIAAAIRSGGLSRAKARYIKGALQGIIKDKGDLSFDFLKKMSNQEAIAYLTSFTGVGVKTASCVLLFALGRPVMPVDTHVFRVSKKLGLLGAKASRESAHRTLGAVVPSADVYSFHVNLVRHGREVCKARRPLCCVCAVEPLCPSSACGMRILAFGMKNTKPV